MILHADLFVRSMEPALEFYCGKLGFTVIDDSTVQGLLAHHVSGNRVDELRLVLLRVSPVGAMIELVELASRPEVALSAAPARGGWVSILVPNLDAHTRRWREVGLEPTSPVFKVALPRSGVSQIVFYKDPDGNDLEFVQVMKNSV
jgi:catechol 2,3-dioxygenase-like lactoylglutathione lyase family enzyme